VFSSAAMRVALALVWQREIVRNGAKVMNSRKVFMRTLMQDVDISNSCDMVPSSNGIHMPDLGNASKPKEKMKKKEIPLNWRLP